ncbi:MAG: ABC transporter substrate-binding protein [Clostridiales bacterium]|nr:ABC transporter substrate-binding protein [Clostridiales bacterium]
MRQRTIVLVLCLTLLLALPCAQAEEKEIAFDLSNNLVYVHDAFYALKSGRDGEMQVLTARVDDSAPRLYCELPSRPQNIPWEDVYEDYPEDIKQQLQKTVSSLFDWGGSLHAINYYTGRIGTVDEGGVHWTEQKINNSLYFENGNLRIYSPGFGYEGQFIVKHMDYDDTAEMETIHLLISDLKSGQTRYLQLMNTADAVPYLPGKLLLQRFVSQSGKTVWQLAELDLSTGDVNPLPMAMPEVLLNGATNPYGAIGYDRDLDRYYYATPNKLLMSNQGGEFTLTALLPFDMMMPGHGAGLVMPNSAYAVFFGGKLAIRQSGQAVELSNSLTIRAQYINPDTMEMFRKQLPGTALFVEEGYITAADAGQMIRNGDTETDLFVLQLDPGLRAMMEKGYAAPLDKEQLIAGINAMYPAVKEALKNKAGQYCGYPVSFGLHTSFYVREHWQKYMGEEAYPTTYLQLFDAMLRFNQKVASEDPEAYFLFDTQEDMMLHRVIYSYIRQYETDDTALDFGAPVLKDTLDLMKQAFEVQRAAGQGPQEFVGETSGDIRNAPSLVHFGMGGGNFLNVPDTFGAHNDYMPPLTFMEKEPSYEAGQMRVMLINPNSNKQELAQQLMETFLQPEADYKTWYALRPHANEPYPNPNYAQAVQQNKEDLAAYTEALEKARESGTANAETLRVYQYRIDLANQALRDQDRLRYLVQQEGLDIFRVIAPSVRYFERSRLLDKGPAQEQLDMLMSRYLGGGLQLDGFLQALTETAQLLYQEGR